MHGAFSSAESKLVDCRKNFSFYFDLIGKELVGPNAPIHRICTLMRKMRVEALLREELTLSNELIEERDAYAPCRGNLICGFRVLGHNPQYDRAA